MHMLMRAYNSNKNKITRRFTLIYLIERLKKKYIYIYNISLETHLASSGVPFMHSVEMILLFAKLLFLHGF